LSLPNAQSAGVLIGQMLQTSADVQCVNVVRAYTSRSHRYPFPPLLAGVA
jgi:hypothetical protein